MTSRIAFVIANTRHGSMIVNRLDYHMVDQNHIAGVGAEVFQFGEYQPDEAKLLLGLMEFQCHRAGRGVVVLDIGANIGTHTVRWAAAMEGWGSVIAVEAQERVFYALAGNIALNNLFNARAINAVVGSEGGVTYVPQLDHAAPANFGGLHMQRVSHSPGQEVDYSNLVAATAITVDSLELSRLDVMKIDVEGMELDVLGGAHNTIARLHPIIYAECDVCGLDAIKKALPGYVFMQASDTENVLCVPIELAQDLTTGKINERTNQS